MAVSEFDIWVRQAAKSDIANCDGLAGFFYCIEIVLKPIKIYSEVPVTPEMTQILAKMMIELISVFAIATIKVIEQPLSVYTLTRISGSHVVFFR